MVTADGNITPRVTLRVGGAGPSPFTSWYRLIFFNYINSISPDSPRASRAQARHCKAVEGPELEVSKFTT